MRNLATDATEVVAQCQCCCWRTIGDLHWSKPSEGSVERSPDREIERDPGLPGPPNITCPLRPEAVISKKPVGPDGLTEFTGGGRERGHCLGDRGLRIALGRRVSTLLLAILCDFECLLFRCAPRTGSEPHDVLMISPLSSSEPSKFTKSVSILRLVMRGKAAWNKLIISIAVFGVSNVRQAAEAMRSR
jgi:hypothetical protein